MSQNNRAAIERAIEAFKNGDLATALREFDPEVVVRVPESLPYGGEYRGHNGVQQFVAKLMDAWETFQIPTEQILADGDTVFLRELLQARARISGIEVDVPLILAYKLVAEKITSLEIFYWDVVPVLKALG